MATKRPLIVVIGPTASGKTGLAIKIAKQYNGEIISADSRAIYRGMDIGTAKPSREEQTEVKHWGIDLVDPSERFTVANFQAYADDRINDIRSRGKLPILAGGSGLYIDSVVYNYDFTVDYDGKLRKDLSRMSVNELQEYCEKNNIILPHNLKNKRYLIRAIERNGSSGDDRKQIRDDAVIVGISVEKNDLVDRIIRRVEQMFCEELYNETRRLVEKFDFNIEAMKSNIYPIAWKLMSGEISRDDAVKLCVTSDWRLAKKQMTWFRRNPHIEWLPLGQTEAYLAKKLFSLNK